MEFDPERRTFCLVNLSCPVGSNVMLCSIAVYTMLQTWKYKSKRCVAYNKVGWPTPGPGRREIFPEIALDLHIMEMGKHQKVGKLANNVKTLSKLLSALLSPV